MYDEKYNTWVNDPLFVYPSTEIVKQGIVFQQFTGMLDNNGKEIYEGDVIRGYFDMGPAGMTINTTIVRWTNKEGYQWKYWDLNSIEVLGNIFENKEKKKTKITNYDLHDHKNYGYLEFNEPPKTTGWDLYITPDFTLNNAKPVNWFNRKMQELILGFKWEKQK